MSQNDSGGDQTEDGELQQSPPDIKSKSDNEVSFSEDDDDLINDSLDIKPPQAKSMSSKPKKRESHNERRSKKSSEKHRDLHHHREKHHREKHFRNAKEREHYQREKERYYREKQYELLNYQEAQYERPYKERKEERKHGELRKHEDRKRETREVRYTGHMEKHHRERQEEERRTEKNLNDLRERLLNKREEGHRSHRESHRSRKRKSNSDSVLEGESGMYVKEIIDISGGDDRRDRRDDITEEERAEQDMRREKLLEAEREMARLKEQSRMERERRHIERSGKRKTEDLEEHYKKRIHSDDPETVTVSDNSEGETKDSDKEDAMSVASDESESSVGSHRTSKSRSRSPSDDEQSEKSSESEKRSRRSSDGSATASPESTGSRRSEEKDMVDNVGENEEQHKVVQLDEDLPPYYPALQGCRSVEEFQCLNRIEEGTYGVVYRARDKRTEEIVALKRLKMEKEKEGFPITSLREINTLLKGQHKNIVTVREIVVGSNMDKIFIVMDYVEHDLKSLIETMRHKKKSFTIGEVKCLLRQLLLAVGHLHDNWILHRDLKTSNLLLSHKGILKVGDFGLAREYGSPLKAYTPIVVTLWYRAPELLLCTKEYSTPIDMWSVGCIFAELLLMNALFPGKSEVDQLNRIFKDLGTPNEKIWTGFNKLPAVQKMKFTEYPRSNLHHKFQMLTELGMRFLLKFLTYDPTKRITADQALKDDYFNETPLPIDPNMFPTWPAKSELGQKRALAASPKPPSGGGEYKKLRGDEDDYGFRIGAGLENRRGGFSLKF